MNIYFITGSSRGLGFELAKQLRGEGNLVVGIARTESELDDVKSIKADLYETGKLTALMAEMVALAQRDASSFTLINNAGMVEPIGLSGMVDAEELEKAITVNLTAPMILSNAFIAALKPFGGQKRIINISSGAGRNAYEGWSVYCTTKAGLDHFSRVVALEQAGAEHPVQIISIAPGIIDTGMQETIRASEEDAFPLLDRFIEYKEKGLLSTAEETAQKLIAFMENGEFATIDPIADLRNI